VGRNSPEVRNKGLPLRDAPIRIVNEAAWALDANSEHEVHIGRENLAKNRTTILISHRFTTMSIVDGVFMLEQGKIVETGSPENSSNARTPDATTYTTNNMGLNNGTCHLRSGSKHFMNREIFHSNHR
jgi:ABC-type transport system involved in cytochrome bd biosynthesis fused ATPase/permease subunit